MSRITDTDFEPDPGPLELEEVWGPLPVIPLLIEVVTCALAVLTILLLVKS
jgi:hypothetical protein